MFDETLGEIRGGCNKLWKHAYQYARWVINVASNGCFDRFHQQLLLIFLKSDNLKLPYKYQLCMEIFSVIQI